MTATRWIRPTAILLALGMILAPNAGCPSEDQLDEIEDIIDELDLDDIEFRIFNQVDRLQQQDPEFIVLPPPLQQQGDVIIIDNSVTIINNIQEDVIIEELPDVVVIGFENLTEFDGYYRYLADGELQGIFVFSGETLLLEYPCLSDIELLTEDYFDPFDGVQVDTFDIEDGLFLNPFDFGCGDAIFFTFDVDGIFSDVAAVDLLN